MWVRANFQPMLTKIGWSAGANENDDTHILRGDLIHILGLVGEDPETIRRSTALAEQYLKNPDSVDASVAKNVLGVAARFGNDALFESYLKAMPQMQSPEQYYNVVGALGHFRDPKLVERVLELATSDETRNQDAAGFISSILSNPSNQQVAWNWVKAHWPAVEKKITMSSGSGIVDATRNFCSTEMRDEVQGFFGEHKVPSAERALKQSFEDISTCSKSRARLQTELSAWLQQHRAAAESPDAGAAFASRAKR